MNTKTVLFVVYGFPPEGARGTKRSIKFIHYLPYFGWSAAVLTVRASPNYCFHDGSLLKELPENLPVYRTRTLESLFYQRRRVQNGVFDPAAEAKKEPPPSLFRRAILSLYRGVGRYTRIPDSRILWLPFAVVKGARAIRQERCRAIYSSGPTHTAHVVGAILARLLRRPLVIDFRDAWVGDPAKGKEPALVSKGNAFLERFCVRVAGVVVCTTDGMKADFEGRYPDLPGKYITITNGFDPVDFPPEPTPAHPARQSVMTILHAGTLGGERSPKEFLRALGLLLRDKPEIEKQLQVVFVGQNSPFNDGRTIEEYVKEFRCQPVVKIAGYVSRKESLDYIRSADLLLMIIGRVPKEGAFIYGISGKIYDYAAARRPVLTIAEPGSTAEMTQRLRLGPVVHPDETEQIKSALVSLLEAHRSAGIPYCPNLELLKSFEFSNLTARLAECFDQACAGRP